MGKDNIAVAVRLRPLTDRERQMHNQMAWVVHKKAIYPNEEITHQYSKLKKSNGRYSGEGVNGIQDNGDKETRMTSNIIDPGQHNEEQSISEDSDMMKDDKSIHQSNILKINKKNVYKYDFLYGDTNTNLDIYTEVARKIIQQSVIGYSGTIFAYGQTSTGKTYTMYGHQGEPGIIPLATQELFDLIQQQPTRKFVIKVSGLEIYNEQIYDLLSENVPASGKQKSMPSIYEDLHRGIIIKGIKEYTVHNPKQLLKWVDIASKRRHTEATAMNNRSSRSHTLFKIEITSESKSSKDRGITRIASLNLVDLAGSERVSDAQTCGDRLKEGAHINKSLMTLGKVISKLSSKSPSSHIPFRDSKLTRILETSLRGNSKTAIICTITPAIQHLEETHSTLKFARRAKRISTKASINEIVHSQMMNVRVEKQLQAALEEKNSAINAYLEKSSQVSVLENKIFGLENLQTRLLKERENQNQEINKLSTERLHMQTSLKQLESDSSIRNRQLLFKIESLKKQTTAFQDTIAQLQWTVRLGELKEQRLSTHLEASITQNQNLTTDIHQKNQSVEDCLARIVELERENELLITRQMPTSMYDDLKSENDKLKRQLAIHKLKSSSSKTM